MPKIFIDGKEGTTGLRIYERFQNRKDVEVLTISDELRKDPVEKAKLINESDITFLCLPDQAAIESVKLVTNPHTKIIDTSTAHRVDDDWAYGFPELSKEYYQKIKDARFVSVPGCHASGAIAIINPLIKNKIVASDYPFSIISLTGYSGGGKKMIHEYENITNQEYYSPRIYGLTQKHKHLKEIKKHGLLDIDPIFNPIVAPYYSGMLTSIGLVKQSTLKEVHEMYLKQYAGSKFIKVMPLEVETPMIGSNNMSGKDYMQIFVLGNDDCITVMARFDNLGKGASGAAIECMNIMLGLDETAGLEMEE